jgi:hypothetical protein
MPRRAVTTPDAVIVTADLLPVATSDVEPAPGEPWARWWAEVAADPLLVSSSARLAARGRPTTCPPATTCSPWTST